MKYQKGSVLTWILIAVAVFVVLGGIYFTKNTGVQSVIKIYSISPTSGPLGTKVTLTGNFSDGDWAGPEYSTQVVLQNNARNKAVVELMPANDTATFTVSPEMCSVSTGASGRPCPSPVAISSGTYNVYYENTYLKETSNSVSFTVTNQ